MYHAREITPSLVEALSEMPVVVLTGLRQTGKSTLLQHEPKLGNRRYVSFDDFTQLEAAQIAPQAFVATPEPITIDEVQRFPQILIAIKREVDRDRRPGRFLLSGSANLELMRDVTESLAGRAIYLTLHPFTRRELHGDLTPEPFLKHFFATRKIPRSVRTQAITAEEVLTGGMPPVCMGLLRNRALWFRGYEQTYLERDVRALSRVTDLVSFRHLLRLAALRTGQILKQSELARDAKLNAMTTGRYLSLMEASFVLWRLSPFLRSQTSRLIKSPKLFMGDSGIACHLAGVKDLSPSADEPLRGALFETYVVLNLLSICASRWADAQLHYWHVQSRHEVDLIVEVGRECVAIEVKASERWGDRDLASLRAFLQDTPRCRAAILAYNGTEAVALGDRLWALPLGLLIS